MEEKKLTDEEIVNAYEHCYVNEGTCKSCCLSDEDKLCVSNEDVLDLIQRQKDEIERLTEENRVVKHNMDFHRNKKFELQKKVDELTEERENMQAVIFALEAEKRQAVKDTAKEILTDIIEGFVFSYKYKNKDWQEGYEQALTEYDNKLTEYFKERYGVEVE